MIPVHLRIARLGDPLEVQPAKKSLEMPFVEFLRVKTYLFQNFCDAADELDL